MKAGRSYAFLVVLSTIWGLAFVAIRDVDEGGGLSPSNFAMLRWSIVSLAFLFLYPFIAKPKVKFEAKDLPRLLVVSLTSVAVYHLALNTAEVTVDASLAGLLISFGPLFIVLISAAVLREPIGRRVWLALGLALAGAVTISLPGLSVGSGGLVGPGLVVVAALASGVFAVSSKPLVGKYGAIPVASWACFLGTAMLVPFLTPDFLSQVEGLSASAWGAVLYLSLLSTVLANVIFYTLVSGQAVSRLGVQLYLVPMVSAAGGVLILGETLAPATVAGGALLLLGVALATSARH
jgi:drug/metabolite transporter (DMT)-like permease